MSYYFSAKLELPFDDVVDRVTEALASEGFGIMTEIDVKNALKNKLNVDFRKYCILGACNPTFALQALEAEDKIGTMLPCNVIVQETVDGDIEVSAVDPIASMAAINNSELEEIASEVRGKLNKVIESL